MNSYIKQFFSGRGYWLALFLTGLTMESVALYFQYALEYGPCPLCIHVRIGVAVLVLMSVLALMFSHMIWWVIAHVINLINFSWLTHRAYLLLGTERGFVYLECGVDPGLPAWLPLDRWLPFLFEVKESCGYTPKLWFDISMAESLMVFFPLMILIELVALVVLVLNRKNR